MDQCSRISVRDATTCSTITHAALVNLSQAVDTALQQVEQTFIYELSYLRESTINLALLTVFFGLSTVLAVAAAYVLFSKDIKRRPTALMLAAIVIMWASTATYWVVTLAMAARVFSKLPDVTSQVIGGVTDLQACLASSWRSNDFVAGDSECPLKIANVPAFLHEVSWIQDLTSTAATTVSVVVGDAIVWWRAWVLWPNSRLVHSVCIVMLLLTIASGVVDIVLPAHSAPSTEGDFSPIAYVDSTQLLLSGDAWAVVVCCVSLLTNVIATALIAYRAWQHRHNIMMYIKESSPDTQVERTLALLVESGLLYCGLWIVVTIYGTTDIFPNPMLVSFAKGFTYVMRGCLVPLIGMYPTLIIIICAVDKSLYEKSVNDAQGQLRSEIRFNVPLTRRRRGTLSELMSTSTNPLEDIPRGASEDVGEDIGGIGADTGVGDVGPHGGPLCIDKGIVVSSPPSPCGLR